MKALYHLCVVFCVIALIASGVAGCAPKIERAAAEPVTLRFAFRQHTVQLDALFQAFHEKYPWITIEPVEANRWGTEITTLVEAGNVHMLMEGREALQLADRGLIRPLDEIQLGDWAGIRDDYIKGSWEGLAVGGQQWGIPAGVDMLVVYVNMEQARALRAPVPDEGWTLFDFLELANAMNFPEGLPHASSARMFGFCTTPQDLDPVIFVYLHGGGIVDDLYTPTMPTLNDPATIEATQWYVDLFTRYGVSPNPEVVRRSYPRGGIYEAALRGHCGVWLGWYGSRGGRDINMQWSMEWKMLPIPRDRATFGLGDVVGYYITKDCQHPKEALRFLRFLADHWEASGTKLPPRHSLLESEDYEAAVGKEILEGVRPRTDRLLMVPVGQTYAGLEQVGGAYLGVVQQAIREGLDPAGLLEEAQDRVRAAFQKP
ncbi:MAG: extracellular solute-binding protein [Chloroflexi bacterium]|nr:extracellular solute-binding protein [Chloroflexota bacterium]